MQESFKGSTPRTATQSVSRQLQQEQRRKTKLPQGKEKEREREFLPSFFPVMRGIPAPSRLLAAQPGREALQHKSGIGRGSAAVRGRRAGASARPGPLGARHVAIAPAPGGGCGAGRAPRRQLLTEGRRGPACLPPSPPLPGPRNFPRPAEPLLPAPLGRRGWG